MPRLSDGKEKIIKKIKDMNYYDTRRANKSTKCDKGTKSMVNVLIMH